MKRLSGEIGVVNRDEEPCTFRETFMHNVSFFLSPSFLPFYVEKTELYKFYHVPWVPSRPGFHTPLVLFQPRRRIKDNVLERRVREGSSNSYPGRHYGPIRGPSVLISKDSENLWMGVGMGWYRFVDGSIGLRTVSLLSERYDWIVHDPGSVTSCHRWTFVQGNSVDYYVSSLLFKSTDFR